MFLIFILHQARAHFERHSWKYFSFRTQKWKNRCCKLSTFALQQLKLSLTYQPEITLQCTAIRSLFVTFLFPFIYFPHRYSNFIITSPSEFTHGGHMFGNDFIHINLFTLVLHTTLATSGCLNVRSQWLLNNLNNIWHPVFYSPWIRHVQRSVRESKFCDGPILALG